MMKKPEILAPAGNFEKLKAAVLYGADAVYLAGKRFGMRSACDNFSDDELTEAVKFAHDHHVKVYVAVNIIPRTNEFDDIIRYLSLIDGLGIDAVIVEDLGIIKTIREKFPSLTIHISTQASVSSVASCIAYRDLGAKRIVLARELSIDQIREIKDNIPDDLELESFIHGSMCIAYSGRCLLSNYLTGRNANRGSCAQPCRWNYTADDIGLTIREQNRPNDFFDMEQTPEGSFIMSSKDMCMIDHIPELVRSGLDSLKIEGRIKSAYYTAVVTNAYRIALDNYFNDPSGYVSDPMLQRELDSVSHREYSTGFFFDDPRITANTVNSPGYIKDKSYLAMAISPSDELGFATFSQRNKFLLGDKVEIISPGKTGMEITIDQLIDEKGNSLDSVPHPQMIFKIKTPFPIHTGDIIRAH